MKHILVLDILLFQCINNKMANKTHTIVAVSSLGYPQPVNMTTKQLEHLLFLKPGRHLGDTLPGQVKENLIQTTELNRHTMNMRWPLDDQGRQYMITTLELPKTNSFLHVVYVYTLDPETRAILASQKWLKKQLEKEGFDTPLYQILCKGRIYFENKKEMASARLFSACCNALLHTITQDHYNDNSDFTAAEIDDMITNFDDTYFGPKDLNQEHVKKEAQLFNILRTQFNARRKQVNFDEQLKQWCYYIVEVKGAQPLADLKALLLNYGLTIQTQKPSKADPNVNRCLIRGLSIASTLLPEDSGIMSDDSNVDIWVRLLTLNVIKNIVYDSQSVNVLIMNPILQPSEYKNQVKMSQQYQLIGAFINVNPRLEIDSIQNPSIQDIIKENRFLRPYSPIEAARYVTSYKIFKLFWKAHLQRNLYPHTRQSLVIVENTLDGRGLLQPNDPSYLTAQNIVKIKTVLNDNYILVSRTSWGKLDQEEADRQEIIDALPDAQKPVAQSALDLDIGTRRIIEFRHLYGEYRFMQIMAKKAFVSEQQVMLEIRDLSEKLISFQANTAGVQLDTWLQSITNEQGLAMELLPSNPYDTYYSHYIDDYETSKENITLALDTTGKKIKRLKNKVVGLADGEEKTNTEAILKEKQLEQLNLARQAVDLALNTFTLLQQVDEETLKYILDYSVTHPALAYIACPV